VPTQACGRRDEKHRPIDTRQQVAGRRQEPSIGGPIRRSTDVTTQDRHLMAEHDDLKLFGIHRSEQKQDKLQDPLQGNRNDGQEHGFSLEKGRHFTQIQLTHPTPTPGSQKPSGERARDSHDARPGG
jgi:hypothetical protein